VYWSNLSCEAVGRYVKIDLELASTFAFLNEIEVYGTEYTAPQPPVDDGNGDNDGGNDGEPEPEPDYVIGDANGNGKIDARDYLLLKRAYFGTYTLTCDLEVADINGNGKIDARDYLLLKRAYFGTYTIQ
ncbi:MAG: dockerin type I repeat-containing protein, partial [Clostridia bacterium]|nr:dockerin type I repeat-containing protein [Clostridia bacterium]